MGRSPNRWIVERVAEVKEFIRGEIAGLIRVSGHGYLLTGEYVYRLDFIGGYTRYVVRDSDNNLSWWTYRRKSS